LPATPDRHESRDRGVESPAARGVEFNQEPMQQPYGIDCALRDPFGNNIRIGEVPPG
jgi:hypothetical protein